ncbi:MAG: ABC transporter substrate-binding protein [Nocardioides sp.]|uniref:hypothetical protein n=1 Tax=Nocardioides sp. TaxID=35761 RepID=UPI0039E2CE28
MDDNRVRLEVTLARYDHAHPVVCGEVEIAGVRPRFVRPATPTTCADLLAAGGPDLADVALPDYLRHRGAGDDRLTALPVFLSRAFRHRSILVHRDRVRSAHDLAGARVGALDRLAPAVVNAVGLLVDSHGLDPARLSWISAADETDLAARLSEGSIDVAVATSPSAVLSAAGGAAIGPLFDDPVSAERGYAEKTGVLPIERTLVARSEVIRRHRWLASNIYRSFEIARRRYFQRLSDIRASRVPIPGAPQHYRALQQVFGDDFWPYGIAANAASLEAALRYAADQGIPLAGRDVDDYFAPVEPFVDGS